MLTQFGLSATREGLYDITAQVADAVTASGVSDGIAVVYCPHTTAAITINESYDPDVARDLVRGLDAAFPDRADFAHAEGNSAAHLRASAVGESVTVIVEGGQLVLGTWQGIYFCEFDPPRPARKVYVKVLAG
ncbi:MAG: secondary thiamine-phosphate synthase enzyme YjbQ [Coriobacteriia bacterium]|nr:secondary thiamine-phosphate synthase enzyme YjbQ [Coriobacteriia bacterium]